MDNCHLDVIQFGEAEDFDLTGCEVLHPEYKTDPHVYYRSPVSYTHLDVYKRQL